MHALGAQRAQQGMAPSHLLTSIHNHLGFTARANDHPFPPPRPVMAPIAPGTSIFSPGHLSLYFCSIGLFWGECAATCHIYKFAACFGEAISYKIVIIHELFMGPLRQRCSR